MTTTAPSRRRRLSAVSVVTASVTGVGLTAAVALTGGSVDPSSLAVTAALFALLGALVMVRQPQNRIGPILAAVGLLSAFGALAEAVTTATYGTGRLVIPGARWAGWLGEWYWLPMLWLQFVALPLLFPDGRLPTPRWRWFGRTIVLLAAGMTALAAFASEILLEGVQLGLEGRTTDRTVPLPNPVGILGLDNFEEGASGLLVLLLFPCVIGATVALVQRFRRAGVVERHQVKVAVTGVAVAASGFVLFAVLDVAQVPFLYPLENLLFAVIPVALGVAILRYRLFDIDRIVSRTLAYVLVTAVLVGLYLAVVVLVQPLLGDWTGGGDVGVAVATLAVAGAFRPVLRRTRRVVDRRFNRRVHHAREVVDRFGDRLRDQVDTVTVENDLRRTAAEILQPATVSLWLTAGGVGP
jgi:hypothetical protein